MQREQRKSRKRSRGRGREPLILAGGVFLAALFLPALALPVQVDVSACRGMYDVLTAMRDGAPRDTVAGMLDALLESPPYQIMFKHYNRSWRPNHLPEDVFKRMILSLQFQGEYLPGENQRADAPGGNLSICACWANMEELPSAHAHGTLLGR